jgi:hypothetical protein
MNDQTSNPLDIISRALADLAEHRTSTDAVFSDLRFLEFKSKKDESNAGKGLIFSGQGHTKQIVLGPDLQSFFVSENLNLDADKAFYIGNVEVLNASALGRTVTKSNIRELGRLKGLIVDGSIIVNNYLHYNSSVDRLGLGTDAPNAAFSVAENAIEVMMGTVFETGHGMVGTFASHDFDIVTDDTPRVTVKANGNIDLGNPSKNPISVAVHGKLSVGVKTPDPSVDLHVAGSVRLNNRLQIYSSAPPVEGTFSIGDIVWNSAPRSGTPIGWVCTRGGNPGMWNPFGDIKETGN